MYLGIKIIAITVTKTITLMPAMDLTITFWDILKACSTILNLTMLEASTLSEEHQVFQ
jgi:hypothetical protein